MRILVAPDSFKGTLSAREAADAIGAGIASAIADVEITRLPFADGGEGTVDAALFSGASPRVTRVSGPLGEPVDATWALDGETAVIEMASASGLGLVTPDPTSAWAASTAGTGELVLAALDAGARRIVIGVGGSATTDGGRGALESLGARFDAGLDLTGLDPRLAAASIDICTDVANPFCGPGGAADVFAPQKGADADTVAALDGRLSGLAALYAATTGVDLRSLGWGGAGGGLAGGLHAVLGATPRDGVEVMAELLGLDAAIAASDLVVVGEGSLDEQSLLGKAPVGIARRARATGRPVVAVVGRCSLSRAQLASAGIGRVEVAEGSAGDAASALAVAASRVLR